MFCWERAPKRLSPLNVPATVMPVRSTESHNDNIYFEAAQDSRYNWGLSNLGKKHTREAGLRFTKGGGEGQLAFYQGQGSIGKDRLPAAVCWSVFYHLHSGENCNGVQHLPISIVSLFPPKLVFLLPTCHHCTWAWEELQEAGQAGSCTAVCSARSGRRKKSRSPSQA